MTASKPLTSSILLSIYKHAAEIYPEECCGLVYAGRVRKCTNIQTHLHLQNCTKYPRDGRSGYTLSFPDQLFLKNHVSGDQAVSVIYHSHPDVGAYFSQEDHDRALYEGQPVYPADYLVVDVSHGTVIGSKLFRFHNGRYQSTAEFPGAVEHCGESNNS